MKDYFKKLWCQISAHFGGYVIQYFIIRMYPMTELIINYFIDIIFGQKDSLFVEVYILIIVIMQDYQPVYH